MKYLTSILLILFTLTASKSNKVEANDFNDEITQILNATESIIQNPNFTKLNVSIKNYHCYGVYEVVSDIISTDDQELNITTLSRTSIENDFKIDTILKMTKSDFLNRLNYEKEVVKYQGVIAGSIQFVTLTFNDTSEKYETKKSAGLISQLTKGKSNIQLLEK